MTMQAPLKKNPNAISAESASDLEVRIRYRAYELYEQRGRADGRDIEDWLQAETELASPRAKLLAGEVVKAARKPPVMSTGKSKAKRVKKPRVPARTNTLAE